MTCVRTGFALLVFALACPGVAFATPGQVIHEIMGPGGNLNGIGWSSDNHLWVANHHVGGGGGDNKVYELDPQTGATLSSFAFPSGEFLYGIAFADQELFTLDLFRTVRKFTKLGVEEAHYDAQGFSYGLGRDPSSGDLYEIEMTEKTIYRLDSSNGSVKASVPITTDEIQLLGHTWAVDSLWVAGSTSTLYRINPATGAIIATVPLTITAPVGVAWDGACLWVSDTDTGKIYQIDHGQSDLPACTAHQLPADDASVPDGPVTVPDADDPGGNPVTGGKSGGCCDAGQRGASGTLVLGLMVFASVMRRRRRA